jgi:magnesium transporter
MDQGTGEAIRLATLEALLASGDETALAAFVAELRPQELQDMWPELDPEDWVRVVAMLPTEKAAELVSNLTEEEQSGLLEVLTPPDARAVLEELDPDDLADALQALEDHDPEHAEAVKALLGPEVRAVAEALASYEEEEAGGLMTPEFVSLSAGMTVERALEFLRRVSPDAETIYYLYVVDAQRRLKGVLSLRELIVASPTARIGEIMDSSVVSVTTATDQEDVARIIADYDFSVLPVVDEEDRLVGIVTVDDVLDVVELEATEDIHRLGAAPVDVDYARARPWLLFRKRVPWLVFLVVSMTLTFNVISHFEDVLAEVVILAAFIPLLIGTGGNVGAQVATLVVRALATRDLEAGDYPGVLLKELITGVMLGVAFGLFIMGYVTVFAHPDPGVVVALGITMILIVLTANLVGASLPFFFRRVGIDPALTSSPGITTVMDVVGLLIYFRVVMWVLGL